MELIIFGVLAVVGIWLAIKIVKLVIRLTILGVLVAAFYYLVYPRLSELLG